MRAESSPTDVGWLDVLDSALPGGNDSAPVQSSTGAPAAVEDRLEASRRERYDTARFTSFSERETDGYLRLLEALVRATPWGREMPDSKMVADQVEGLRLLGAYNLLFEPTQLNASTGLPSQVCMHMVPSTRDHLKALAGRESTKRAVNDGSEVANNQLRALQALGRLAPNRLGEVRAQTVELDPDAKTRTIVAYRDRYVSPGVIQRVSIEIRRPLEETRSFMKMLLREQASVSRDGGDWSFDTEFAGFVERYSSVPLEKLTLLLQERYGDDVLRVSRGTLGPVWFEGGDVPAGMSEILARNPGSAIAEFSLDRVTPKPKDQGLGVSLDRAKRTRWLTTENLRMEHDALAGLAARANIETELRTL
ncbi:MAG: hypothetical protein AAF658_03580 [Myxococcota bacterium]